MSQSSFARKNIKYGHSIRHADGVNMHIVVLGGAGVMGSASVRDLVQSKISRVTVADYNIEAAERLAAELLDEFEKTDVSAQFVDANDQASLIKIMKTADAVASAIGPFYKFGSKVVKAAIEAGVNLVDICDDADATLEAFKLDREAEKAGVSIVVGLGMSPGLTNILAKCGSNKMDAVEEIRTSWVVGALDPGGPADVEHGFHMLTGNVPTFKDGQWIDVPAGSEKETVEFLPPIGKVEVYHVGHPEPVTLPRFVKGVKTVTNKGALFPHLINQLFSFLVDFGFSSTQPIKVKGVSIIPREFSAALMDQQRETPEIVAPHVLEKVLPLEGSLLSGTRVEVKGSKDKNAVRYVYRSVGQVHQCTGAPLSIGAQMLARGEIKPKGVLAPEACIDPKTLLSELNKREIEIYEVQERLIP